MIRHVFIEGRKETLTERPLAVIWVICSRGKESKAKEGVMEGSKIKSID